MKKRKIGCVLLLFSLLLSGCQLERKVDINNKNTEKADVKTGQILKVELPEYDLDAVTQAFLGYSVEKTIEMGAEKTDKNYSYQKDKKYLYFGESTDGSGIHGGYRDFYENAATQYKVACDIEEHINNVVDYGLRKYYPNEELETCSKQEVLDYCESFAKATGFENAKASVYAMTVDILQPLYEDKDYSKGAPIPGYEPSQDDELVYVETPRPWTKDYEALLVIYQPYMNELLMDSRYQSLMLIYVPKYGKIVWAEWDMPWKVTGIAKEEKLISASDAVSKVMMKNGILDENILEEPKLVYSLNLTQLNKEHTVCLCWRIDYQSKNSMDYTGTELYRTMLVNAVTGEECQMFDFDL